VIDVGPQTTSYTSACPEKGGRSEVILTTEKRDRRQETKGGKVILRDRKEDAPDKRWSPTNGWMRRGGEPERKRTALNGKVLSSD